MNKRTKYYLLFLLILFIIYLYHKSTIYETYVYTEEDIPKIYFITMNTEERKNNVNNAIKKANIINYDIFNAIDGGKIDKDYYINNNYINNKSYYKLRKGQIGVAISHLLILEQIIRNNEQLSIIMEDDIDLTSTFKEDLLTYIKHLPNDIELSQIQHINIKNEFENVKNVSKINDHVKKGIGIHVLAGYLITLEGAKKLVNYCKPIDEVIDWKFVTMVNSNKIKSYLPMKPLVHHDQFDSSIWSTDHFKK
jgi:glycosyl transferase, family 25